MLKKEIMETNSCCNHKTHHDVDKLDAARACFEGDQHLSPSNKHTRTSHVTQRTGEDISRIRLPPCLTQPELHAKMVGGGQERNTTSQVYHPGGTSAASVGSKIMASLSLHKIRHHRSTPSLEDDPFWLAMLACTNDADKVHRKGPKGFISREIGRSDTWLARRVQESIHFDQCMPRQASENRMNHISRKEHSSREAGKAMDRTRSYNDAETLGSIKGSSSRKVHHTHTDVDVHHHGVTADGSMHSARLASKAFKAVSMARAEVHGRCKALLQQQNPPIVDISCSSRRPKSKHGSVASKQKPPVRAIIP